MCDSTFWEKPIVDRLDLFFKESTLPTCENSGRQRPPLPNRRTLPETMPAGSVTSSDKTDRRRPPTRRATILEHARLLFAAHGLYQVTTRQIARAVGISQPSLYAHFPNRDAIAVEVCRLAFSELASAITARAGALEGCSRIRAIGAAYIDFGLHHPAAYRVAFMLEMPDKHQDEKDSVLDAGLQAFSLLQETYESLLGQPERAALAAQLTWASLHGLVSLLLARPDFPFRPRAELIEHHLDGLFRRCREY